MRVIFICFYCMKLYLSLLVLIGILCALTSQIQAETVDTTAVDRNYVLHEVVITGTRNATDIRHLPMTLSIINRSELEKRYEPSLLPTLTEQIPGLFATSRGVMGYGVSTGAAGSINVRGIGSGAQMLVLIDGHPQYMGLFGHPIADAYQTMLAERVEVLRGPASVLYGSNAMGGVINIVTRQQKKDGVRTNINVGTGSYGTVQTEATNRIRKNRFSSIVAASYNRTDGHRPDIGFEQYGGYAKLGYDINNTWNVYGDVNVTHFNASNPGPVYEPLLDNNSRITRGMASFALQNNYKYSSGALGFFYNWGRHKINDGYEMGKEPQTSLFNSKDLMMGVSWYQSAILFKGNRLTLGFDYQHFFSTYLSMNVGLRMDHHSHVGTELVPQGGLAFHLPRNTELKAMVSKGFRNPTIREMYMFPPQNPDLKPERLMNYELSFTQKLLDGNLCYGANIYYINGDNTIMTTQVNGYPKNINTGFIENWGIESNIGYCINSQWKLNANYSWLHMENPVLAAPEHKLYAGFDFTQGRWGIYSGVQYVKGLYVSVGETQATEDFILWNIRGIYRLCKYVDLYAKGENLLAQQYEIMRGYPMPKATFMGGININF